MKIKDSDTKRGLAFREPPGAIYRVFRKSVPPPKCPGAFFGIRVSVYQSFTFPQKPCLPRPHAGGNKELSGMVPGITIYGGSDKVEAITKKVGHGDKLEVGNLNVECLFTPCHTSDSLCYFVRDSDGNKAVFSGSTVEVL